MLIQLSRNKKDLESWFVNTLCVLLSLVLFIVEGSQTKVHNIIGCYKLALYIMSEKILAYVLFTCWDWNIPSLEINIYCNIKTELKTSLNKILPGPCRPLLFKHVCWCFFGRVVQSAGMRVYPLLYYWHYNGSWL